LQSLNSNLQRSKSVIRNDEKSPKPTHLHRTIRNQRTIAETSGMVAGTKTAEQSSLLLSAALFSAATETLLTGRLGDVNTHFAFFSHFSARGPRPVESVFSS